MLRKLDPEWGVLSFSVGWEHLGAPRKDWVPREGQQETCATDVWAFGFHVPGPKHRRKETLRGWAAAACRSCALRSEVWPVCAVPFGRLRWAIGFFAGRDLDR